jgi:hypothetical protein
MLARLLGIPTNSRALTFYQGDQLHSAKGEKIYEPVKC